MSKTKIGTILHIFLHILHLFKQIFKDTFSLEIFLKYTAYEGYFHQSDYLRNLGNSDFLKKYSQELSVEIPFRQSMGDESAAIQS